MKEKIVDFISDDLFGNELTFSGLGVNCKAGPCLQLKNGLIYIPESNRWDIDLIGKKIQVTGTLMQKKLIPDPVIDKNGAISTGAYGEQLVLENIKEIKIIS